MCADATGGRWVRRRTGLLGTRLASVGAADPTRAANTAPATAATDDDDNDDDHHNKPSSGTGTARGSSRSRVTGCCGGGACGCLGYLFAAWILYAVGGAILRRVMF